MKKSRRSARQKRANCRHAGPSRSTRLTPLVPHSTLLFLSLSLPFSPVQVKSGKASVSKSEQRLPTYSTAFYHMVSHGYWVLFSASILDPSHPSSHRLNAYNTLLQPFLGYHKQSNVTPLPVPSLSDHFPQPGHATLRLAL